MTGAPLTMAQAAQQNNRDGAGKYTTKQYAEDTGFVAPSAMDQEDAALARARRFLNLADNHHMQAQELQEQVAIQQNLAHVRQLVGTVLDNDATNPTLAGARHVKLEQVQRSDGAFTVSMGGVYGRDGAMLGHYKDLGGKDLLWNTHTEAWGIYATTADHDILMDLDAVRRAADGIEDKEAADAETAAAAKKSPEELIQEAEWVLDLARDAELTHRLIEVANKLDADPNFPGARFIRVERDEYEVLDDGGHGLSLCEVTDADGNELGMVFDSDAGSQSWSSSYGSGGQHIIDYASDDDERIDLDQLRALRNGTPALP